MGTAVRERAFSKAGTMVLFMAAVSCGSANLYQFTTTEKDELAFDAAIDQARINYDKGQYAEAVRFARLAYQQNPQSERAAVFLAHSIIGQVGLDPIQVTQALLKGKSAEEKADDSKKETKKEDASGFAFLRQTMGLTAETIEALGTVEDSDPSLPLLLPYCAEEVRATELKLALIDEVLLVLCPFVADPVKIADDYRHVCTPVSSPPLTAGKVHFIWGLAHLAEAVVFNTVLTYSSGDDAGDESNLQLRAAKLKTFANDEPAAITESLKYMQALQKAVAAILPSGSACSQSMLQGNFNDLMGVHAAFASIAGLPKKIFAPIQIAIDHLNKISSSLPSSQGGEEATLDASTLQAAITSKISGDLTKKIEGMKAAGAATEEQLGQMCALYDEMIPSASDAAANACAQ